MGYIVEIFTNATQVVLPRLNRLLRLLCPSTDMIQISLDGPHSLHQQQRVGSSKADYDCVAEAIRTARLADLTVRVNMTATPQNVSGIALTYREVQEWGASLFRVNPFVALGRAKCYDAVHKREFEICYLREIVKSLSLQCPSSTMFDFAVPISFFAHAQFAATSAVSSSQPILCFSGAVSVEVLPNGDVFPSAAAIYDSELCFGNIFRDGLARVWGSEAAMMFRGGRDLGGTKCGLCNFMSVCRGGSEERAYAAFGTIHVPDPECSFHPNARSIANPIA
jgi:radical SAM protein with 4Fe4S-binding SPASM domain